MGSVLVVVLLTLATARVTWLITEDALPLVSKPRDWISKKWPGGNLEYLSQCWWCVSIYVAAGAAAFAHWAMDLFTIQETLVLWPAFSFAAVGLMSIVDTFQAHGSDD